MSKYYPEMDIDLDSAGFERGQDNWADMMASFFNSDKTPSDTPPQEETMSHSKLNIHKQNAKLTNKKRVKKQGNQSRERYSTLDFLKCLDNTLQVSLGSSLNDFAHELHEAPVIQKLTTKRKLELLPTAELMPKTKTMNIDHVAGPMPKKTKKDHIAGLIPDKHKVVIVGDPTATKSQTEANHNAIHSGGVDQTAKPIFLVSSGSLPDLPPDLRYLAKTDSDQIVVIDADHPTSSIPLSKCIGTEDTGGRLRTDIAISDHGSLKNLLVLCLDEGKQGWAASHFLTHGLNMNVLAIRDPIHRAVNDWKQAVKQAGLWCIINASTLAFNICYGPWGSESWWSKAKGAARSFINHTDTTDPLFRWLENKISSATNDPFFELKPEILEESLESKGEHVSLCRWFSWVKAAREHMPMWWPRLAALITAGLETKLFDTNHDFLAFRSTAPALKNQEFLEKLDTCQTAGFIPHQDSMPDSRVHTTQHQDPDVKKIRQASKNTLHACCRVMADDIIYQKCMFIMMASIPFHDDHGALTKTIAHGPQATLQLYASWSFGSWLPAVRKCAAILTDLDALSRCSLTVTPSVQLEHESSYVLAKFEDYQCQQLNQLVLRLMSNRIQSMLWHTDDIPGLLASLCHDNPDFQLVGLQRVSGVVQCLRAASASTIPFASKRAASSSLHIPAVAEIVAGLEDFTIVPSHIKDRLKFIFSGYGSTEIIEKLFRFLRVEVEYKNINHKVSREKRFSQTVKSNVMEMLGHKDNMLQTGAPGQSIGSKLDETLFKPTTLRTKYLSLIASRRSWPSPTPHKIAEKHGDIALFQLLAPAKGPYKWQDAIKSWHSSLLIPGKIYKPSRQESWSCIHSFCGQPMSSLLDAAGFIILSRLGPAALAWPLEEVCDAECSTTVRFRMKSCQKPDSQSYTCW